MVLKADGEDLESDIDRKKKSFVSTRHGCFVGSSSFNEIRIE